MSIGKTVLSTQNLAIGYLTPRPKIILDNLNLTLHAAELVALLGQNGVGKSTLLRTLAKVQKPLSGDIYLKHRKLIEYSSAELARNICLVLTEKINPGHLNVYELIALGRYPYTNWAGKLGEIDKLKIDWAIEHTKTNYLAYKRITELSDGQLQKVMIARALAQDGDIIILDEPTVHLDLNNKVEIMILLKSLAEETGKAILVATHELDLTLQVADKLWLFNFETPFREGIPEDLVLSGAFQDTFYQEGFDFDSSTGKVMLHRKLSKPVKLVGDGPDKFWTIQALERKGYKIDDRNKDTVVTIFNNNKKRVWKCEHQDHTIEATSIAELLNFLNSRNS